jgi:cell division protein ZapA
VEKAKINLTICGVDYVLLSEKPKEYLEQMAAQLDAQIGQLLRDNGRISATQAAVLCALSAADGEHEAKTTAENLRTRIQEYLEDAARMKKEAELFRHEAAQLHRENAELRRRLGGK